MLVYHWRDSVLLGFVDVSPPVAGHAADHRLGVVDMVLVEEGADALLDLQAGIFVLRLVLAFDVAVHKGVERFPEVGFKELFHLLVAF